MMSAARYASGAKHFASTWNGCRESCGTWTWVPSSAPFARAVGSGYLIMEGVPRVLRDDHRPEEACEMDELLPSSADDPIDEATAVTGRQSAFSRFDFHIVYHPSYQVPVLFFNGFNTGGSLLSTAAIQNFFRRCNAAGSGMATCDWTFVASEEHPILRQPFFMLHPCRTAEVMQLLVPDASSNVALSKSALPVMNGARAEQKGTAGQYFAAWFSVFGPAVGLKLPRELWPSAKTASHMDSAIGE